MNAAGAPPHARPTRLQLLLAAGILVLGVLLRLCHLDEGSLFIDEAESSLNALTILEHGYPSDHYLGLPLFENTLTQPWPESEEYEFRDTSYSSRGMAIYHGWLPLYAIAASQALHGVRPDEVPSPPRVQHDEREIQARIHAARLPAVWFGALFLVAMFLAGTALYGVDAGLAAMLAAAVAPRCIWLAQQARYYSATLALSTLAALCAWRVWRHGRWRDFALAGLAFVLLFHCSSLSFALLVLASAVLLPGILRHERAWAKLALWLGIVAAGLVPWMLWSGYLENLGRMPMARALLAFPGDYLVYLRERPGRLIAGVVITAAFAGVLRFRRRLPARLVEPVVAAGFQVGFLAWWIVVGYFGFQLLVPAASCSMARLSHAIIAAPLLLGGVGVAVVSRIAWPRGSAWLAPAFTLAVMAATGNFLQWQRRNPYEAEAAFQVVEHLRGLALQPDTRVYSLPYQHFSLMYYTGLPIQSIAPVRREFLERYPGEVIVLETTNRLPQPSAQAVQQAARHAGVELDETQAGAQVVALHAAMIRAELVPLVRAIAPGPGPEPAWFAPAVAELVRAAQEPGRGYYDYRLDNPAMFKGFPPLTIDEFWPAFFYRFVGPEGRRGANLNYASRMREAEALLLPSTWVVLRCPARAPERGATPR